LTGRYSNAYPIHGTGEKKIVGKLVEIFLLIILDL